MYKAKVVSKGDQKYQATTQHSQFQMASDGSASKPTDTLLAALCACLAHYVGDFLKEGKISFSDYSIRAECGLSEDGSRLGDINVVVEVPKAAINGDTKSALLSYMTQCHIFGTLKANSKINLQVASGS
jgi:uncharacterized OsmC-like protein